MATTPSVRFAEQDFITSVFGSITLNPIDPIEIDTTTHDISVKVASTTNQGVVTTGAQTFAGAKTFTDITDSSSISTGALIVSGGLSVAKKVHSGDQVVIHNSSDDTKFTTLSTDASGVFSIDASGEVIQTASTDQVRILNTVDSSSLSTGSVIINGGLAVAKKVHSGDQVVIHNASDDTKFTTLATDASGVFSIDASGNAIQTASTDQFQILNTTDSSDITTGGAVMSGGLAVAKKVHTGDSIFIHNISDATKSTTLATDASGVFSIDASGNAVQIASNDQVQILNDADSSSLSTGSVIVNGGLAVTKKLNVGDLTTITTASAGQSLKLTTPTLTNTEGTYLTLGKDTSGIFNSAIINYYHAGDSNTSNCLGLGVWGSAPSTGGLLLYGDGNGRFISSTISTSTSTGALTVNGGLGVGERLTTSTCSVTDVTDSSSTTTGSAVISGGLGVAKKITANKLALTGTGTGVITIPTGSNITMGGITLGEANGDLYIDCTGNDVFFDNTDIVRVQSTAASTSVTTGCLIASGGIAAANRVYVQATATGNVANFMIPTLTTGVSQIASMSIGRTETANGCGLIRFTNIGNGSASNYLDIGVWGTGAGSGGIRYFGTGTCSAIDTTDSSSITTGSFTTAGGLAVAKKVHTGDNIVIHNVTDTSKSTTLATDTNGYFSIDASGNVIQTASTDQVQILNTTDSSSVSTGGLVTSGGLAVAKKVHTGDDVVIHCISDDTKKATFNVNTSDYLTVTSGRTIFSSPIYLPTSGGTAYGLNYYEEYLFETTCTGALVDNAININLVRVGKNITATITGLSDTRDADDTIVANDLLPTRFRPATNLLYAAWVTSGGSLVSGSFSLTTTGILTWSVGSSSNFASGTIGIGGDSFSWIAAV